MASENGVRQRKAESVTKFEVDPDDFVAEGEDAVKRTKPRKTKKRRSRVDDEDDYTIWVDVLRVLSFLFLASCGLSYLISNGESWFWGMQHPPNYLRLDWWKIQLSPTRYFTLEELAKYDGSSESTPVYLSINGSVFDVSAGRRFYGPGGSYHFFAGVDASRGFVTGCFADDRNGDVRGVEEMFLPIDDPEVDKHWTDAELQVLKQDERRKARKRVDDALGHWVQFFSKSKKYHYVGKLKREPGWEGPMKPLCEQAQKGRSVRKIPGEEE